MCDNGDDIEVRGIGRTKGAVLAEPATAERLTSIEIECAEPDDRLLPVDWFNALVFEHS